MYLMHGWHEEEEDEHIKGHTCGYHNLHALYARNVSDWIGCNFATRTQENFFTQWWWGNDPFTEVHFYKVPAIALSHNMNIGHSLWDHMLTYLPHWFMFRAQNNFPFDAVASFSIENCLSDNTTQWYCELLRAIDAFDGAAELNLKPRENAKVKVLNCFERIFTTHLALPRMNDFQAHIMPSKQVFYEFRRVIFDKFELPRGINYLQQVIQHDGSSTVSRQTAAATSKRLLLYAHEPSGRRVWTNMRQLVANAQRKSRYTTWKFTTVHDFGVLSLRQQARLFNQHDVLIMVHGAQMANSIFTVDGTVFIEIGCDIPPFLGEETYLSLIGGRYGKVVGCEEDGNEICLKCK
jgi:hypothetical protein